MALREIADETVSLEALGDGRFKAFSVMLKWTIQMDELDVASLQAEINGEVGPANALEEIKEDVLSLDDGDGDALSDHAGDVLMEFPGRESGEETLD